MKAAKQRTPRTAPNQHVTPHPGGGWAVLREGSRRPTSLHRTQREAMRQARERARAEGASLIVHGRDGKVRSETRYGADAQATALAAGRAFLRSHRRAFERLARL
jgi:Uncharacterized protein conserved in bacteria (DUF2188)